MLNISSIEVGHEKETVGCSMVHAQQPSECGSLTKAENNACNIFQSFGMVPFFDQVRMEVMQAARSPAFAKRLYSLVSCVARAG